MESTVELEGAKEMSLEVTSTVMREPAGAVAGALPPLLRAGAETEKMTLPLEVAMGIAEAGVETGTACTVGERVAVVRGETGRMMPSEDVEGAGAGDAEPSVAEEVEVSDGEGGWLELGETMMEELRVVVVALLL